MIFFYPFFITVNPTIVPRQILFPKKFCTLIVPPKNKKIFIKNLSNELQYILDRIMRKNTLFKFILIM